jgi:AcrR family transcriptional regulator
MSTDGNRTEKPPLSTKVVVSDRSADQRVRRTRDRLGDALVEILLQKPLEEISVQEILDRAGVSRSTFYTHFRDTNDLFLSDVDDFFEGMATALSRVGSKSKRVAPVHELFSHIGEQRAFYSALVESGRVHDVIELGQAQFARGIEQRLTEIGWPDAIPSDERSAIAHAFAGALFSLLSWWIHHRMPKPAEEMDKLFHEMVWAISAHGNRSSTANSTAPIARGCG